MKTWESEPSPEFLQARLRRLGLVGILVALIPAPFRALKGIDVPLERAFTPLTLFHFLSGCAFVALWLLCRGKQRSPRLLRWAESCALIAACTSIALMGAGLSRFAADHGLWPNQGQFIVLMSTSQIVFARAVIIPSSPRRTMWLTIACAAGLVFTATPAGGNLVQRDAFGAPSLPYLGTAIGVIGWWTLTTTVATFASSVIYGLRREVQVALQCGQYTLEEKIGEGGMGVVYRARHGILRRMTAIKLLPVSAANGARSVARFEDEVQHTARLSHPNTVTIFDYGRTPEGIFYYAMELLDGETVEDTVNATGAMPPERVARILQQIAGALQEAHAAGLVHRDIKPSNVVLCNQGGVLDFVKVVDFGLAHPVGEQGPSDRFVGTPLFAAPEALAGNAAIGPAADIYGLGALAYFMLTGEPVFRGKSLLELGAHHLHSEPEAPSLRLQRPVPDALEALVLACLAKSAADRPTAAAIGRELEASALVRAWSQDAAAAWWHARRAAVRAEHKELAPADLGPFRVDVQRRLASPAGK